MPYRLPPSLLIAALLLVLSPASAEATTWGPTTEACPLCQVEGRFEAPMSSGSYIYQWPSRLQVVFWPATESRAVYSCTECRFTAFMWDFKTPVPEEKRAALIQALEGVKLPVAEPRNADGDPPPAYLRMDRLAKLAAAEVCYRALGTKTDDEWSRFYRAWTYQALDVNAPDQAKAAAKKCLEVTARMAADPERKGFAKEDHLVLGAMHRVLEEWDQAREQLAKAKALTYTDPTNERAAGVDEFLTDLIGVLEERVAEESKPKQDEGGEGR